ncbi:hypothetical protein NDK50_08065 [Paraburkholderia bryophila]|uniref:hypothetical protein n=1 Tax=Paraburkholderia bryophila TaxID=420952 RepID=UPI00234A0B5D|nr:hypothetical protein [Paraburkholderia bryophila]WCM21391.1 hypothetical protein NDK50_08065 [Paraburkholderia bryophila]
MSKPKTKIHELIDLIREHGPVSPNRLTELSGDMRQSVDKYVRQAHDKGLIHIAAFGPSPLGGNRTVKLYAYGKDVDAERVYASPYHLKRAIDNSENSRPSDVIDQPIGRPLLVATEEKSGEWSPEEDAILADIYSNERAVKHQANRLPGRSYPAMKARAVRLRLEHKKPVTDGSLSWIKPAIIAALSKGVPLSAASLNEITGASRAGLKPVLKRWHRVEFRIAGWERAGAHGWLPQFALGNEPDVPKPQPKSMVQACREWRERQRIAQGKFDPFASFRGLAQIPAGQSGRIYRQSMEVLEDELEAA